MAGSMTRMADLVVDAEVVLIFQRNDTCTIVSNDVEGATKNSSALASNTFDMSSVLT